MATRKEIIGTQEYWMETVQGEVYRLLSEFMESNDLNQTQVAAKLNYSSSYISQILNGNFNFTIGKLISLALAVGQVPVLSFKPIDEYLNDEKYPENRYRYTSRANSDGGCFVDMELMEVDLQFIIADKSITIRNPFSSNSISELSIQ
jgi:transcriptional regulator with XRE-family HTH domain